MFKNHLFTPIILILIFMFAHQRTQAQCTSISTLTCGASTTAVLAGAGVWNITSCGFSTPGLEKVYSFTPTTTGVHSLQVTSVAGGYIDYFYKDASGGCISTGWTCIDDINFTGTYTLGAMTAGVQYYILLDPEGTGSYSHTFQINCPVTTDPCLSITTLTCATPTTATLGGTGVWNSSTCFFSTPGQEKIYSFTPTVTGIHNLQVTSATGTGYIDYQYKAASGGCIATGWTCIDDINFTTTATIGTLTAGVQYYILLDAESTSSSTQTFQINCPAPPDACSSITTITCATPATATLTGSGVWNSSTCFFSTPGQEKIYSFTPTVTGIHNLQVTSATSTGYIDYQYKAASGGCIATGWTCIDDINFTGTFPIGTLTAGVQYYILLDAESTTSSTQTFQINCPAITDPCSPVTTLTCATPVTATLTGSGVWNSSTCFFSTPGQEKIYSFTPTVAGVHQLQVTSASGTGYIDYQYKAASGGCSATGWTCIDDINFTGTFTIGTLTAGVQYYILLDAESTTSSTQTFQINCPSPIPSCLAAPVSPINSATVCQNVTLSWPVDALATSYDVYFGTSLIPPFVTNGTGTTYNAGILTGGTYYWQIRPKNGTGTASGCPIWSFTVNDPVGNSFANPIIIGVLPFTHSGNNLASNCWTDNYSGGTNQASPDVFYTFTNTACQNYVTISLCGSSFNTYLHLLNSSGTEMAFNDDDGPVCPGSSSSIQISLPAGAYYIVVEGSGSNTGNYNLSVSATDNIPPMISCPSNIELCGSQVVTYATPTATDNCSATVMQTAGLASGSVFPAGTTVNTFQATDGFGNNVSCSFSVIITGPEAIATPSSQTICSGSAITAIALSGSGTTFTWVRDNVAPVTGIAASGTGNISGILTNTTNVPITVTFTIIPFIGACQGLPVTATVLVNPAPNVSASPTSQTICSGDAISPIMLSGNVSGTIYAWTRDNTIEVTGIATSGSGNITGNLVNTTNAPVTVTFTVTPTANGCPGAPITAHVTVNPVQNVDQPANQVVCNGTSTSVNFTGSVGSTFNWSNTTASIGLAASGTGNIAPFTATNNTNAPVTATVTVTPSTILLPGFAYIANEFGNTVSVINTATNTNIATIGVGAAPAGLILSPDGSKVYVTNGNSGNCHVINTSTNTVSAVFNTGGSIPKIPAISPDGSRLYIPNLLSDNVAVFNTTNNSLITTIPVGSFPISSAVSPDGSRVFIGNAVSGTISVIDATTNTVINTLGSSGPAGIDISPDGSRIYISNGPANSVSVLDGNTLAVITNIGVGNSPTGLEVSPDGTSLYVANINSGSVSVINTNTNTLVANIPVAISPYDVSFSTDGLTAYVTGYNSDNVSVINTVTKTVITTIPAGDGPISVDVTTPSGANCTGDSKVFTITVNPTATVNTVANQTLCNGSNTTAINFSSPTIGGSIVYNWTNNTPSIGISASGNGNISSFTANNTSGATVVATITVTPAYINGSVTCNGTPITFTITVYPTPNAVATPSSQTICSAATINPIVLSGNVTGTSYSWTRDNSVSVTGIAASGSGDISGTLTNTTTAPITVTFTVTPSANGCPGTPITATVLVNPIPNAIVTPASQTVCSAAAINPIVFSGSVTGTTYSWTRDNIVSVTGIAASGSGNISGTLTNTTTTPLTVTFIVTPTANGCVGPTTTATVLVNPTPNAIASPSSQTICSATAINMIVISGSVTGSTYSWTRDNTASVTGIAASGSGNISGTLTNTTTAPVTVTFTVTPTANGCTGAPVTATVLVNPTPNVIATPVAQTVCSATSINTIVLTGSVAGTTYSWIRDNTGSVTGITANGSGNITGTLTNTTTTPVTVTFTVTPTANGCTGTPVTATVLVNPTPNAVATPSSQTICSAMAITNIIMSGAVSGTTYSWTRDNTGSVTGIASSGSGDISGTLNNTTTAPVTVTFTVTPTANGCTGPTTTATVLVNPTPNAIATPTSQTICSAAAINTIILSGSVSGTAYTWTRDNTVSVTGIAASGTGNISGTLTNTTTAPVTVTYTVTPSANGCAGPTTIATVLVNPTPNAIATPTSQTVCSATSISAIFLTGNVTGTTYSWTRDNTASVTGIAASGSGNISGILTNTTFAPVLVTFTVTPSANGCPGAPITATVLVNPTPNAVATPPTQTKCSGVAITTIVLTGSVAGTTYSWTRNNTATATGMAASGSGNISGILTNVTSAPVLVTFTVTPLANGCPGPAITATVLVNPAVSAVATPASQTICTNATITPIILSGPAAGTTFSWTRNNTGTVTGIAGSGSGNITGVLINSTNSPVTVTFTITPSANGCTGNPITASVIVNPTPVGTISISPNPACVGSTVQLSASGGTTYNWSGPQGWTSTLQNPAILLANHLQGGQYSVTITSGAGCSVVKYASLNVYYPPVATATYEQSTACVGSTLKLHATGAGAYAWTGPAGFFSTLKDPVISNVSSINNGVYTLIVTSPNGCSAITTINITINTPPALTANPVLTQICEGSTIQLFATGTGNFAWSGPLGFVSINQNPVINSIPIQMSGTYTVTLTSSTGCSSQASVAVKVYPQIYPNATVTADSICEGQSVQFHAEGGSTYLWVGPNGFHSNESDPKIDNITPKYSGIYYVYVYNEGGCFAYDEVEVTVIASPPGFAYASPNPVNEFSQVQFFASNTGTAYSWTGPLGFTSNIQNPVIKKVTRFMSGVYTVTIINENGCPSIFKVILKVLFKNNGNNSIIGDEDELNTRSEVNGTVFPNPTNDILYFETLNKEAIEYMIFDVSGKIQTQLLITDGRYISTDKLASGIYHIRWRHKGDENWIDNRFVKIR